MPKKRSPNYIATVRHSTEAGAAQIETIRAAVRIMNAQLRKDGEDDRFQVTISGRKGSDPHAWKYDNKHYRDRPGYRRLEDMERVDVYISKRV